MRIECVYFTHTWGSKQIFCFFMALYFIKTNYSEKARDNFEK